MLTVVGPSPAVDVTYVVDDYRLGEIHRPTTVARCAGGKALNMARAARRAGAEVALATILGGATGGWIAEQLAAEGVPTEQVAGPETRTCVSVASAATGQLTEIYEHAPVTEPEQWRRLVTRLEVLLDSRPGWLSTSGSMPSGLPDDTLAGLVRLGHDHRARVAIDSHGPALSPALEAAPDLVKINRSEAAAELGVDPNARLTDMARVLGQRTGGWVVLTDGADGAVGWDGTDMVHAAMPDIRGRFPVGSGDSFLGGLLADIDRGVPLAEALRTGTACGIANALVPGAGYFEVSELGRLRDAVTLTAA